MRDFMFARKVAPELQAKIKRYLENQAEMKQVHGDYQVMSYLSPSLRVELTVYINRQVIMKYPFFKELPRRAALRVCLQANPAMYAPGDIVVERGDLALSMLFIVRGKLRVEKVDENKSIYLDAGSWLGDKCLFTDTQRTHTVSAVTPCECLVVKKRTVLTICREFPTVKEDYDSFQKRICDGENIALCEICNKMGHSADDCPLNKPAMQAQTKPSLMPMPTSFF